MQEDAYVESAAKAVKIEAESGSGIHTCSWPLRSLLVNAIFGSGVLLYVVAAVRPSGPER